jgi:transposase-like protein
MQLNREQMAAELGISVNTLDRWRREWGFPSHKTGPRFVWFDPVEVQRWQRGLEARKEKMRNPKAETRRRKEEDAAADAFFRSRGMPV